VLTVQSEQKWKQLAELATSRCEFGLAQECLHQAHDYGGLTLLASAAGNADMIGRVGAGASTAGHNNVAFLSYFVLGKYVDCIVYTSHTHLSNSHLSRTTQMSQYQNGKTSMDFTAARYSEWQWHQLGHMQVCTSLQTDNHASTPPLSFLQA